MVLRVVAGWLLALLVLLLRWSCRLRLHGDPRPELRRAGVRYAYAILHGHQLSAILAAEAGTAAMVSRSADGDLLIPALRVRGVSAVRGSSRLSGQDKGGRTALEGLIAHVRGGAPAYFAVDGPRGPRGEVGRGVALLAEATGAAVVLAVPVPRRRWIVARAWDRFQIPRPFTRIDVYFAPPLRLLAEETSESFRLRVQAGLAALEGRHDPDEHLHGRAAAERQRLKLARRAAAAANAGR